MWGDIIRQFVPLPVGGVCGRDLGGERTEEWEGGRCSGALIASKVGEVASRQLLC